MFHVIIVRIYPWYHMNSMEDPIMNEVYYNSKSLKSDYQVVPIQGLLSRLWWFVLSRHSLLSHSPTHPGKSSPDTLDYFSQGRLWTGPGGWVVVREEWMIDGMRWKQGQTVSRPANFFRSRRSNSFLSWGNLVRLVKGAIFKENKNIFTDAIYIWIKAGGNLGSRPTIFFLLWLCSLILDGATAYVPTK